MYVRVSLLAFIASPFDSPTLFPSLSLSYSSSNLLKGGGLNQSITEFKDAPSNIISAIWDLKERNVVHLFDGKFLHTYIFVQYSVRGPLLLKIGPVEVSADGEVTLTPDKIEIPLGNTPIISIGGILTCQTASGNLNPIIHPYFTSIPDTILASQGINFIVKDKILLESTSEKQATLLKFCQSVALLQLENAWQAALELDKRQYWLALSHKAMEMLNVELALRVYRQLGDAGMVMALENYQHIEDRYLLAGNISLLFGDYQRAQELFLASTRPVAALDMRRDLLQWEQALQVYLHYYYYYYYYQAKYIIDIITGIIVHNIYNYHYYYCYYYY